MARRRKWPTRRATIASSAQPGLTERAVIIGAGMGGLATAAALSPHVASVQVLERDPLPDMPVPRAGVPQGAHFHRMLVSGLRALEGLCPGYGARLQDAGAVTLIPGFDVRKEQASGGAFPRRDCGLSAYTASRPLFEAVLRQSVARLPNVTIAAETQVARVLSDRFGEAVVGVAVAQGDTTREVPADMVVDASGSEWLASSLLTGLGRPPPEQCVIGVDIGYASAVFELDGALLPDWKGVVTIGDAPADVRAGMLVQLEGGRWIATLAGRFGDFPPTDPAGFIDFARSLCTSTIHDALAGGARVGPVRGYRFPENRWLRYERMSGLPSGWFPLGDSICRLNPIYGQGMSVACLQAAALRSLLSGDDDRADDPGALQRRYLTRAADIIDTPWWMSAIPDFVFPGTRGERPQDLTETLELGRALMRLAATDPAVHLLHQEVSHLLRPRSALDDPALRARLQGESPTGAPRRTRSS